MSTLTIDDLNPSAEEIHRRLVSESHRLAAHHRHLHAQGQIRQAPEGVVSPGRPQENDQEEAA